MPRGIPRTHGDQVMNGRACRPRAAFFEEASRALHSPHSGAAPRTGTEQGRSEDVGGSAVAGSVSPSSTAGSGMASPCPSRGRAVRLRSMRWSVATVVVVAIVLPAPGAGDGEDITGFPESALAGPEVLRRGPVAPSWRASTAQASAAKVAHRTTRPGRGSYRARGVGPTGTVTLDYLRFPFPGFRVVQYAASYCSMTMAGMRPRSLTLIPRAFAHVRISALRSRVETPLVARRRRAEPTLRALSTNGWSAARSCLAFAALRSIS